MADSAAKQKSIDFLDRKAFGPVLGAKPGDYPASQGQKLQDVQRATRSEQNRFHHYGSADEVYRMFRDDLHSEPAQKIHRELRALNLPTLNELEPDFTLLARDLGVTG